MQKTKKFEHVYFDEEAIRQCRDAFLAEVKDDEHQSLSQLLRAVVRDEEWEYEDEDELFADIRRGVHEYQYRILGSCYNKYDLIISRDKRHSRAVVSLKTRVQIERVFAHLESSVDRCILSDEERLEGQIRPTVFIGHGRSKAWRDLKDHLQDKHGIKIVAYEIGARAGHTIRDILEEMLEQASIAFLVMTAEDIQEDGTIHSRQNVVHEVGLFQGKLGFPRGIVLLEEGTKEFSNLHGIQQIRFSRNSIRETFGDVLATIRREFEDSNS